MTADLMVEQMVEHLARINTCDDIDEARALIRFLVATVPHAKFAQSLRSRRRSTCVTSDRNVSGADPSSGDPRDQIARVLSGTKLRCS